MSGSSAGGEWTPEQIAEFGDRLQAAIDRAEQPRLVPLSPPLSPDEIRALLRECVTVVKPGEVLVIRASDWTPDQVAVWQDRLGREVEGFAPWIRLLIIPGDAAQALSLGELDAAADAAVERALSRQRYAQGGNGRDVSGAGGASSIGNDSAFAAVTPGNSGSGGAGTTAGGGSNWASARFTVTGGSDGFPDGVRAVVTPGQGGSRVSFLPGGAGPAAGGCCGGNCGCGDGGQQ